MTHTYIHAMALRVEVLLSSISWGYSTAAVTHASRNRRWFGRYASIIDHYRRLTNVWPRHLKKKIIGEISAICINTKTFINAFDYKNWRKQMSWKNKKNSRPLHLIEIERERFQYYALCISNKLVQFLVRLGKNNVQQTTLIL